MTTTTGTAAGLARPIPTEPLQLVVLDMAGTTVHEHGLVYEALRGSVEALGASVSEADLQRWMGTDKTEAITALARLGGLSPSSETVQAAFEDFKTRLRTGYETTPPVEVPGAGATFAELRRRGVQVALTTGFSTEVAHPLLAGLGWGVGSELDAVVCADEVARGRPAPYLIQRAMERCGVIDVRAVAAVGDTHVDVEAALNAGVTAIGVLTGKLGRAELEAAPHHLVVADVPTLLTTPAFTDRLR